MFNSRFEWAIIFLIVLLLGGAWIIESRESNIEPQNFLLTEAPLVGHLAPDFTAQTIDYETFALSEYVDREGENGRPVVLNFWASWCGPCRMEMPAFERASLKFADRAAILGVNQAESAETIERFAQTTAVTYPLLIDEDQNINYKYAVTNLPTTIFVDAQGVIREVFVGTMNQAVLENKINALLEE
ncbi:MAG: TlpA family protein disulfide reductase [Candidatus Promineifilaceae bacterium]|jgi:cytochrome c biogenesis protein CcmG/thiol:disulfide interchange protein DsbE